MKIYAPNKNANGIYASVQFVNGVGETDNPKLIEWFRTHGYKVPIGEVKNETSVFNKPNLVNTVVNDEVKNENDVINKEPDFEAMSPIDLREYMKANGLGSKIKNIRNKEKLLEILRG